MRSSAFRCTFFAAVLFAASLSTYAGKVLLVVNTASECGYTPQYEGLEKLYERDASKGLAELGEPKWNFHKYLVDRKGVPVKAFPSSVKPDAPELLSAMDAELAK